MKELAIILDFGGQYTQLIARRVRELAVYSEIVPHGTPLEDILDRRPKGIILSGGPASVYEPGAPAEPEGLFECGLPVLGICYGAQLMAERLGGRVSRAAAREYGSRPVAVCGPADAFTAGLPAESTCWMSHGDHVETAPPGWRLLLSTPTCPTAAMVSPDGKLYGVQFHPEVEHTPFGRDLLGNFLFGVCGFSGDWTMGRFIDEQVALIRERVGEDGRVVAALSGGVDSSVAVTLVHRAVGDRLTCIFVDHGLLRKDEAKQVIETFRPRLGDAFVPVNEEDRFLGRLAGVTDPERKRRIIGEEFIRVFEREAVRAGDARFLVQGTIYPDVVESGTRTAQRIKSHHNVAGLPEVMHLELIEPLRPLFKDEVRRVGLELGLPEELVWRQPFPGPGLAVRVLGEVTCDKLAILREADAIWRAELKAAGLERAIWQSFAVLPDVRSVGVMGDSRTYAHLIGLRAVTSVDAMTADWARIPDEVLAKAAARIVNEVEGVNRVVYDITSKPPGTIEWE
ncbi:MAG: glutamine-hydrolyzing GMP synthase [Bacillota bacterium]|nr:glutamine-hydrolyzing GMP synthase [Bacillota bacterium]